MTSRVFPASELEHSEPPAKVSAAVDDLKRWILDQKGDVLAHQALSHLDEAYGLTDHEFNLATFLFGMSFGVALHMQERGKLFGKLIDSLTAASDAIGRENGGLRH